MTTDKEHAALEWLDGATHPLMSDIEDIRHTNTLKSMLARPVVPDVNDHRAIDALLWELNRRRYPNPISRDLVAEIIRIINEPPAPKTKTVQVWRVEYAYLNNAGDWCAQTATHYSQESASNAAKHMEACNLKKAEFRTEYACIRVTGPHSQEVPIEVAPAADGCRGRTLAERRA